MDEVVPIIKVWKNTKIDFSLEKKKDIMKPISDISFPNLVELWFSYNDIESIEGLSRINLPALKILDLGTCLKMKDSIRSVLSGM